MDGQPSEAQIQQVVALIERVVNPVGLTEAEDAENLNLLMELVVHPDPFSVIRHAEEHQSFREAAIEMLAYRPTPLGYTP